MNPYAVGAVDLPKVTLMCSAHRDNGLCNVEQLLRILRRLEPDVIFEETPPSNLGHMQNVEARAIAAYREYRVFQQVPVDRYEIPANLLITLRVEMDRVFECVEQTSEEYLTLKDETYRNAYQHGFAYLNSPTFAAIAARLCDIEDQTIGRTQDQRLIRALGAWRLITERREREMISGIYDYCRSHVVRDGVFLVGAAHKAALVAEMALHSTPEAGGINWSFAYENRIIEGAT